MFSQETQFCRLNIRAALKEASGFSSYADPRPFWRVYSGLKTGGGITSDKEFNRARCIALRLFGNIEARTGRFHVRSDQRDVGTRAQAAFELN